MHPFSNDFVKILHAKIIEDVDYPADFGFSVQKCSMTPGNDIAIGEGNDTRALLVGRSMVTNLEVQMPL